MVLETALADVLLRLQGHQPACGEYRGDEYDLAAESQAAHLEGAERERLEIRRRLIEAAIERIKEGEYGVCTSCVHPIERGRLNVIPWVETCIKCQERIERDAAFRRRRSVTDEY